MSRIGRYQSSMRRFINTKSTLLKDIIDKQNLNKTTIELIKNKIHEFTDNSDMILPILFLTIMNSQNKKNKVTIQGFYAAASIEYLLWICKYLNNSESNTNLSHLIIFLLSSNIYKSLEFNLETLSRTIEINKFSKIQTKIKNVLNDKIRIPIINWENINYLDKKKQRQSDIYRYYLKDKKELNNMFKQIKLIEKKDIYDIIQKNIGYVSELSTMMGWLFGCGDIKQCSTAKKIGLYFGLIYVISNDYQTFNNDIKIAFNSKNKVSINYVINCGFQQSYEDYIEYKQNFITCCLLLGTYTGTVKELVEVIDCKIDAIIDTTSPDLKSTSSNYTISPVE